MNSEDKFWASARQEGGCLIWQLSINAGGYGQVNYLGRIRSAHRVAYELAKGAIHPGMNVCHACDNRPCINPDHLFLGTYLDNNRDMFLKGRGHVFNGSFALGERNVNAKLTRESASEARRLQKEGCSLQEIANRFGVTKQAIWYCVRGKTWVRNEAPSVSKRHLTDDEVDAIRGVAR